MFLKGLCLALLRRARSNILGRVSLKAKLEVADLERLLLDVRRQIEFDVSPPEPDGVVNEYPPSVTAPGRRIRYIHPSLSLTVLIHPCIVFSPASSH